MNALFLFALLGPAVLLAMSSLLASNEETDQEPFADISNPISRSTSSKEM